MKIKFFLLSLALLPLLAQADPVLINKIYFNLNGTEAEVTNRVGGEGDNEEISNSYSGSVSIPSSVYYAGKPYTVTSIGNRAFFYCSNLTSVTIPNSVISIGDYAFIKCSGLTSITIPNSVTSIGNDAFSSCSGLTSVTIPQNVTSIGVAAFYGCDGLTSIKVESGNTVYDSRNNCNAIIETSSNTLVTGCKETNILSTVTAIGQWAFGGCSGLTSITFPNSVTTIHMQAFYGCDNLTSVTFPNSVTSIGDGAFYYCYSLTSVSLPNSLTAINDYMFYGCTNLTSVTIPQSVTSIGRASFAGTGLTDVYCYAKSVPTTDSYAFYYTEIEHATLHVPASALEDYKNTEPWSGFGIKVALDDNSVATGVMDVAVASVRVKSHGGVITVEGIDNHTSVSVYTMDGMVAGTGATTDRTATISTSLKPGTPVIVKMGEKAVKTIVR